MATAPISDTPSRGTDPSQPAARPHTPGLTDALGQRLVTVDSGSGAQVELLWFKREFSESAPFVEAVRKRLDEIGRVRHRSLGIVRGVKTLAGVDGLVLMSMHVPGRRLAELLPERPGAAFVVDFVQQVTPAMATLHQQGPGIAHGLLNANRVVVATDGHFVVIEHTLGPAFASLRMATTRMRSDFGLAVPAGLDPDMFDQRSDIVQIGLLALSLLAGRQIDPADVPARAGAIIEECFRTETSAPSWLRSWIERALQIGGQPFANAVDAQTELGPSKATVAKPLEIKKDPVASTPPATAPAAAVAPSASARDTVNPMELTSEADAAPAAPVAPVAIKPLFADAAPIPERRRFSRVQVLAALGILILGGGAAVLVPHLLAKPAGDALPAVGSAPLFGSTSSPNASAPTPAPAPPPASAENALTPEQLASSSTTRIAPPVGAEKAASGPATKTTAPPPAPAATKAAAAPPAADADLAGVPGQDRFGAVRFSAPIELQVLENGAVVGSTVGSVAVTEGSHSFDVINDQLGFRARQTVAVKAGRQTAVTIAIPNGQISINAVPWADVLIDGKSVGQTPIANFSVPIGSHEVVFRHPRFGERTQTAVVKVSGLTRVSATFQN